MIVLKDAWAATSITNKRRIVNLPRISDKAKIRIINVINIKTWKISKKRKKSQSLSSNVGIAVTTITTTITLEHAKAVRPLYRTAATAISTTLSRRNLFALSVFRVCSMTRTTINVFPALPSSPAVRTATVGLIITQINQKSIAGNANQDWLWTPSKRSASNR